MITSAESISNGLKVLLGGRPEELLKYGYLKNPQNRPTVLGILDDFSTQCFAPELNYWSLARRDIDAALDHFSPDFLLVESAWNGSEGEWRYQLTSDSGPKDSFYDLITACRNRSIPTVFWNKEDPPHFQEFLPAAKEFDYIFTTEESLVTAYMKAAGHENVNVLQFGAQPTIHSPLQIDGFRAGNIAFAGQYFAHKFPERREQMDMLFPPAQELGLSIFSRMLGGDKNYAFPERYEKNVVGSLPYHQMVDAYRRFKVYLNVNSVPESQSMCARRIFELASSKTAVVSSHSSAIHKAYSSNEVFTVKTSAEAADVLGRLTLDHRFRESATHLAWRTTATRHLYRNRIESIISVLGLPTPHLPDAVHVFLHASSTESVRRLLSQLASQACVNIAQVTLVGQDLKLTGPEAATIQNDLGTKWKLSIAANLDRQPIVSADTAFIAFISDRYDIAPNYLLDMRLYLEHYSATETVAKGMTGTVAKPASAYVQGGWPEDIQSHSFLAGAWMTRASGSWFERIKRILCSPSERISEDAFVTLTDRFNIREASTSRTTDWVI
ncbi:CgeB family protein [Arthrobacter sp. LFS091]|uniref:CgeB family protein n=1 Tax=Arthrobacter sp. LFS091 TaxID=3229892 RepID=UPI003A7FE647